MHAHLLLFAAEFHWTPSQVWGLAYGEYVGLARYLDELNDERRAQARKANR